MRSLIISVVIIVFALAFVIFTEVCATASLDELIKLTESLPDIPSDDTGKTINDIEKLWNDHEKLYLTVTKSDQINIFTKELASAKSGLITDDDGTYLSSKNAMLITLKYIKKSQDLCIWNVF